MTVSARAASGRGTGEPEEALLGAASVGVGRRRATPVAPVRLQLPGGRVGQFGVENGVEPAAAGGVAHRRHHLNAPPQVAGTTVGRAEVVLGVAAEREVIDAGVLEEAAQ